ncbi:MAG: TlpA family protein disulfide reductase [Bacteroidales bacterium]|nr:TlpA family protein disulfide reductase [Bacteroidales bacterium]MBN2758397.1 TlpA family protein disulfide reductase [Bacteroidales bacterium]
MKLILKKLSILTITFILLNSILKAQTSESNVDQKGFVIRIGDNAEDFYINYADGRKSEKLSDLKGKVVMLQFTASWCGVCRKEMPHIENDIWKKYKDKGLIIIGIDLKETIDKAQNFSKIMKITYPLALDEEGEIFSLYAHPNAGVTRNVLIDKNGKIVFLTRLFEENEFKEMIKKIEILLNN